MRITEIMRITCVLKAYSCYEIIFVEIERRRYGLIPYPDRIYDLIDYHLKECIRRGVKLRKCKNCGRYFVVSGHGGAEYCDRPFNARTHLQGDRRGAGVDDQA